MKFSMIMKTIKNWIIKVLGGCLSSELAEREVQCACMETELERSAKELNECESRERTMRMCAQAEPMDRMEVEMNLGLGDAEPMLRALIWMMDSAVADRVRDLAVGDAKDAEFNRGRMASLVELKFDLLEAQRIGKLRREKADR